ncbi:ribonuclease E/G [Maritimibacter sp. DP1N21-5]|uniref:ribonuclease E/G n=1 Tax=Maritimibacter sp. DP1N21-5 TaxID=2836867 RepID=UPI001C443BD2|nr:ribonuclease E/G [Maritimibacter sp. DP1N21-5]MBV7410743.1 ribonuclease E/G [Maritimibacter sp. DP1N21-5]
MKGSVIALDEIAGRKAAALIVDGKLDDFLIDPAGDAGPVPGAIFRAICDRPMKGQGGMFLRLPEGDKGFLRAAKGLAPGQPLLVQTTGWSEEGKAPGVTHRVLFKSRFAIVTPEAPGINISRSVKDEEVRVRLLEIAHEVMGDTEHGLILRSQAAVGSDDEVADDIAAMRDLALAVMGDGEGAEAELLVDGPDAHDLAWRDWPRPEILDDRAGSFERHNVDDMIHAFSSPRAGLGSDGFAYIEQTRALVAVDVNTGGDNSPAAGLKANIALAKDLPRQLRCRGLGGQITLDLAPMGKKDRRNFEQTLKSAFRRDPVETVLAGWTPLGHFELQRKRDRLPVKL